MQLPMVCTQSIAEVNVDAYLNMQCLHIQERLQLIFIFQIWKQISLKFCDIKEREYYHSNWLSDSSIAPLWNKDLVRQMLCIL